MKPLRRWLGAVAPLFLLVGLVGCDHVTKLAAKSELQDGAPRNVLSSVLRLQYVENRDMAFNLLRFVPEGPRRPLLTIVGAIGIAALAAAVIRARGSRATRGAFLLILAGAIGNYADRLVRGYVVDFIRLPRWPVFNVADVLVVAGVGLLFWDHAKRSAAKTTA